MSEDTKILKQLIPSPDFEIGRIKARRMYSRTQLTVVSLKGDYVTDINNNCKIPTDYKVHKPVVHLDHTASFGN